MEIVPISQNILPGDLIRIEVCWVVSVAKVAVENAVAESFICSC